MCGIVGYIGEQQALPILIGGLSKLEYRGYDSAGVAVANGSEVFVARATGKLSELKKALNGRADREKLNGSGLQVGIGHTRWATHGRPAENNAHPHTAGRVSLIHNGIIENYLQLREQLERDGCEFKSETDTEIAAHLLNKYLESGLSPFEALKATCADIRGSYAFVALDSKNPDRLLVAKNSTPIIVGIGNGESFVASDIPAILDHTRQILVLEDGDLAEITTTDFRVENGGRQVERAVQTVTWDPVTAQKGGYKHFMLKEIHEQGSVLAETFRGRVALETPEVLLPELNWTREQVRAIERVQLLGCGTAWHACLIAQFYIEAFARIPCDVDYSSEYRYRRPIFNDKTLVVPISQSGETADTLAALDVVLGKGERKLQTPTLAICNVLGSSLSRRVERVLFTHAGPEISVASTKAFTTQLTAALLLAVHIGQYRGTVDEEQVRGVLESLLKLPGAVEEAVATEQQVEAIARRFNTSKDFLYLGRGLCYPIALEGALKLKEISYIHAEGYPAGEMKHGPIALIDENMPVVLILQKSETLFEKTVSNLKEVEARGGQLLIVTDAGEEVRALGLHKSAKGVIEVPHLSEWLAPILLTIPLQLLAYYVATLNGTDVDLPRNLAKSVTVE